VTNVGAGTQHSAFSNQPRNIRAQFQIATKLLSAKREAYAKIALMLLIALLISQLCLAETGAEAWLRYHDLKTSSLPTLVAAVGDNAVVRNAADELVHALGNRPKAEGHALQLPSKDAFVLGVWKDIHPLFPELSQARVPRANGFWLKTIRQRGAKYWLIIGADDRGVLYGTFSLMERIAQQRDVAVLDDVQTPSAPIRWVSEWDNLDGSIERGYAGRSIFFDDGAVRSDLTRARQYARLLASVGINGCSINNVNASPRIVAPEFIPQLARVADVFRPWGVKLAVSVDMSSPMVVGGLKTFDPLDPQVAAWWKKTVDEIYKQIPDFGGFVVKADSEGRSGPSQYGRTASDAANVIARALKPHGGILLYRAFVYNHHLDWRDPKADRARAAYDYFHPLDGKFEDNVVIQIKYGPIDFQVREPASPLFGAMPHTSKAIELQVTQEYTGQQRHLVFLPPMWKQILDFDMHVGTAVVGRPSSVVSKTPVKDIVSGKVGHRALGGFNAVVNVGLDENWLGHPLAIANLYGYGRLAWNPDLSSEQIAEEWIQLTFGSSPQVANTISKMLLPSWHIYESYTGPLGLQTLTDITGPHYGPGIESSENNGWGQWHRADAKGVGMDRTIATGTGFIGQYSPFVQKVYDPVENCPDELLLFMHHVPYTYVLHDGQTVIQYLYDSHYEGAEQAAGLVKQWKTLRGQIDDERYSATLARLQYQAGHAIVWRDAVVNWFNRMSGIPDAQGRVGHNPNRFEAESMQLVGYAPVEVAPWETASGGHAVACAQNSCSTSSQFTRPSGTYDIAVQYFDQNNGISHFELFVNDRSIGTWAADDHLPSDRMNGHTSTRHVMENVQLHSGDLVRIVGRPNDGESAPLDYVEFISGAGIRAGIDENPASRPH
jgi:alpha-glucuronidase